MRDIIVLMRRNPFGPATRCAAFVVVAALACVLLAACRDEAPPPITVADRVVTVHNQSAQRWTEVRVWLNDHYLAGTPVLDGGGKLTVPQRDFVAAMGQKFDPARQSPYGVLVTAKSASGDVKLVWGQPYRKQ